MESKQRKRCYLFFGILLALLVSCATTPQLNDVRQELEQMKQELAETRQLAEMGAAGAVGASFFPASVFLGGGASSLDKITSVAQLDKALVGLEGDGTYGNAISFWVADDIGGAGADDLPNTIDHDEGGNIEWQRANPIYVYTEFIPVDWMQDGSSAPAESAIHNMVAYRDFDEASAEDLIFIWKVPDGLKEATANQVKVAPIILISNGTAPAGGTDEVAWGIAGCSVGDGDSIDCTLGAAVVDSDDLDLGNADTQWDIYTYGFSAVTVTNLAATEYVYFKVYRDADGTGGTDDYAQDIGLIGLLVKYVAVDDMAY